MNIKTMSVIGVLLLSAFSVAQAAEIEAKGVVLCALIEARECTATGPCHEVAPDDINIRTRFLDVDFRKKELRAHKLERATDFSLVADAGDRIILTGTDATSIDEDGVGYSMSISKSTGSMVLSVSGDQVAFSLFGACTSS